MPAEKAESTIELIDVNKLRLDPENPRLPEGMDGTVSEKVVEYYIDNYVLDELVDSYIESGYFQQEPMVVRPSPSEDTYVVLEGNRRLAALIQLLRLPGHVAKSAPEDVSADVRKRLRKIPCLVVQGRGDIASYLGFRHIGGLKPWPPEAKARFVASEIESFVKAKGSGNPFAHVGRMIGTNAQAVRESYYSLRLLRYGRAEYGIDVAYVLNHRFGVWQRCMSSKGIAERLGISIPHEHGDFKKSIESVDSKWLKTLVEDLTTPDGKTAILEDSRDVTIYGYVINNKQAHKLLRQTRDLAAAELLVSGALLAPKIEAVTRRVDALILEAENLEEAQGEPAYEAARGLSKRANTLARVLTPSPEEA